LEQLECLETALRDTAALLAERVASLKLTVTTTRIMDTDQVLRESKVNDGYTIYEVSLNKENIFMILKETFDAQISEISENIKE
jgi:hypothetical protein